MLPYFEVLCRTLRCVEETSQDAIRTAGEWVADCVERDGVVWLFGSAHASLVGLDCHYRAGGPACAAAVHLSGLEVCHRPITETTRFERTEDHARSRMSEIPLRAGDVLIVHSVSGRNPAPVEVAEEGRNRGAKVLGIVSLAWARSLVPRTTSGRRLHEVVDLAIDNCVPAGDAAIELEGMQARCAPLSTAVGVAIVHSIFLEAWQVLLAKGVAPPVFRSANEEGGDEWNATLLARYGGRLGLS